MSEKKIQITMERELDISEYLPCQFCGSTEYDLSDGAQNEQGAWVPHGCDCCGFGLRDKDAITWH